MYIPAYKNSGGNCRATTVPFHNVDMMREARVASPLVKN